MLLIYERMIRIMLIVMYKIRRKNELPVVFRGVVLNATLSIPRHDSNAGNVRDGRGERGLESHMWKLPTYVI
jgi:hypothetical protein